MPQGELFIKCHETVPEFTSQQDCNYAEDTWYDAYDNWGVSLEDGAIETLMAPPSSKEYITNECRLENGTRYAAVAPKVAERELTLPIHLVASSKDNLLDKYRNFCIVLRSGKIDIRTSHQSIIYKLRYKSCTPNGLFLHGMAKYTLRMVEPNPTDRPAYST
ncbi:MAG: hypothetical protein J5529_03020 [Prevotella sp.]|nr:hypothetical protein [Prevotella sp.]